MTGLNAEATDAAKPILKTQDIRNRIIASCRQRGIRPIDLTDHLLREKGVFNVEQVMDVVRKIICEFYGIGMWELAQNDRQYLMDKYGIPANHMDTLYAGNIYLAYQEFAKSNNGDDIEDRETPLPPLPKTTTILNVPEQSVKNEEYKMLLAAKQNLTQMMDGEKNKDKLELYEAQMKVLDLKIKNAKPGQETVQPN